MHSVTIMNMLILLVHVCAKDKTTYHAIDTQESSIRRVEGSIDKLVGNLVNQMFKVLVVRRMHVDSTNIQKPGQLKMFYQIIGNRGIRFLQPVHYRPKGIRRFETFRVAAAGNQPLNELDMLRLRVATAKARLDRDGTKQSLDELEAAEAALFAYEADNPSAALKTVITSKQTEVSARGRSMADDKEAWRLEKLCEETNRCDEADAILAETANAEGSNGSVTTSDTVSSTAELQWQRVARSLAEFGYWVLRGSVRAELSLLRQLTEREGYWEAREADSVLRKAWATSGNIEVAQALDSARASLRAGNATKALSIYDRLCEELAPDWPEAWHRRGQCLHRALHQRAEAERSYEMALRLNPRRYPTILALAQLLLLETDEAVIPDSMVEVSGAVGMAEITNVNQIVGTKANATDSARQIVLRRRERARELLDEAVRLNPLLRPDVRAMLELHGL